MATKISRRKLAAYAADRLVTGDAVSAVMRELAAYLIDTRRQREYELIVRDIETALLMRGTAIATTISARTLSTEAKQAIEQLVKSEYQTIKAVHIKETVDERVLGGVKLVLPDRQLDATASAKLEKLGV
jgi:F0F1-type ATP synthase delta subunit